VKINFKKGWDRIFIILSVVWGGFCFYFVVENEPGADFGLLLLLSVAIWGVGLVAFLLCIKLIGWVIAGFIGEDNERKKAPWMGALLDNLEVLTETENSNEWGRAVTETLLNKRIKLRSLNFMRGRTFQNRYIIVDEAQNLTSKQMKTLITRVGPGSKMICLGNVGQIDTPYITETTSGLTYVIDKIKNWDHSGHITLLRGERSRLADFASSNL